MKTSQNNQDFQDEEGEGKDIFDKEEDMNLGLEIGRDTL